MATRSTRFLGLCATLVARSLLSAPTVEAVCGVDQALFNTRGLKQGYEGELYSAVRCYLKEPASACDSPSLPKEAKGYDLVREYYGHNISTWCTGEVESFFATFYDLETFNEPLLWNTSSGKTFRACFGNTASFNSDISSWDLSQAEDLSMMFISSAFSGDISRWQTGTVTHFSGMFNSASSFNRPLPWNFSSACSVDYMFFQATSLDQDLNAMGRQLLANSSRFCDGFAPTMFETFSGTSCPVVGDPKDGGFCRPAFDTTECLVKRFKRIKCKCSKQSSCSKALTKGSCKRQATKAGVDKAAFERQAKSVLASLCKAK